MNSNIVYYNVDNYYSSLKTITKKILMNLQSLKFIFAEEKIPFIFKNLVN